jgi:hypothetical protein
MLDLRLLLHCSSRGAKALYVVVQQIGFFVLRMVKQILGSSAWHHITEVHNLILPCEAQILLDKL